MNPAGLVMFLTKNDDLDPTTGTNYISMVVSPLVSTMAVLDFNSGATSSKI